MVTRLSNIKHDNKGLNLLTHLVYWELKKSNYYGAIERLYFSYGKRFSSSVDLRNSTEEEINRAFKILEINRW